MSFFNFTNLKHPFKLPYMDKQMLNKIGNIVFIISPAIGYIPQLVTNNVVFSPLLSLILILSGLMRILYYQVEKYSLPILLQTFVLIITQLLLIYRFRYRLGVIEEKFYNTCKIEKYTTKHAIFTINAIVITTIFFLCHLLGYLVGGFYRFCIIIGAILESSVGVLQIYFKRVDKKYLIGGEKRRMPKELFACWIVGDLAKAVWMYKLDTKRIFFVPIIFQIIVDGLLMFE